MPEPIEFRRGDLVWVLDREGDEHRMGIVEGLHPDGTRVYVLRGDGLRVDVPREVCVPIPVADPKGAVVNFAEFVRTDPAYADAMRKAQGFPPDYPWPLGAYEYRRWGDE